MFQTILASGPDVGTELNFNLNEHDNGIDDDSDISLEGPDDDDAMSAPASMCTVA